MNKLIRKMQFNSPMRRYFFPRYTNNFTPQQLTYIATSMGIAIDSTDGGVAEVGCSIGQTSVFLCEWLKQSNPRSYYAIDTFAGFVDSDVQHEVSERGKRHFSGFYKNAFSNNSQKWFEWTIRNYDFAETIQADCNSFDFSRLGSISFCLLDVDLYKPIESSLPKIWKQLQPGGIIIVDDCDPSVDQWDGAHQAYTEFCKSIGYDSEIVHGKLGILCRTM